MPANPIFIEIADSSEKFLATVQSHIAAESGDELPYVWAPDQLRAAVSDFRSGDHNLLDQLICLTDRLLQSASHSVREFASVGLIEDMQNSNIVPEEVQAYILSQLNGRCKIAWDDVMKFWNGEIPVIPDRLTSH